MSTHMNSNMMTTNKASTIASNSQPVPLHQSSPHSHSTIPPNATNYSISSGSTPTASNMSMIDTTPSVMPLDTKREELPRATSLQSSPSMYRTPSIHRESSQLSRASTVSSVSLQRDDLKEQFLPVAGFRGPSLAPYRSIHSLVRKANVAKPVEEQTNSVDTTASSTSSSSSASSSSASISSSSSSSTQTSQSISSTSKPSSTTISIDNHWTVSPIRSTARRALSQRVLDDAKLQHWIKPAGSDTDYRFSPFATSIQVIEYSNDEYSRYLNDPLWSREQTDELMRLCKQYDCRFYVVHDRFATWLDENELKQADNPTAMIDSSIQSNPSSASSSLTSANVAVEHIKDRFYSIQKTLLSLRNSSDPDLQKHPMMMAKYNLNYEIERKQLLKRLFARKQESVVAIAKTVMEYRKVTHLIKSMKMTMHRTRPSQSSSASHKKKKGYAYITEMAPPINPNEMAPIPPSCIPLLPPVPKDHVWLRSSQMLTTLSTDIRQTKSLEAELLTLGIKKPRELIPTSPMCELYTQLRMDILTLSALQKHISKREMLRDQVVAQVGHLPPQPSVHEVKREKDEKHEKDRKREREKDSSVKREKSDKDKEKKRKDKDRDREKERDREDDQYYKRKEKEKSASSSNIDGDDREVKRRKKA